MLAMPSNLLAHHLQRPGDGGVVGRATVRGRPSPHLPAPDPGAPRPLAARRTTAAAGSVRLHRQLGPLPPGRGAVAPGQHHPGGTSAGTHPAGAMIPGASTLPTPPAPAAPRRPRHLSDVLGDGDLVVTVCDLAHEELGRRAGCTGRSLTRSEAGRPSAFDAAFAQLAEHVDHLVARLPQES